MPGDPSFSEDRKRLEGHCDLLREIVRVPEMNEGALLRTCTRIARIRVARSQTRNRFGLPRERLPGIFRALDEDRVIAAAAIESHLRCHSPHRIAEQAALLDRIEDAIVVEAMDDTITCWNRGAVYRRAIAAVATAGFC